MDPKQRAAFARRVFLKRHELYPKMALEAFCEIAGITRTTLRVVEDQGSKQRPQDDTIEKLARAFRMTPEELKDEQRIEPDNKLLKDLTEEDLRVAQMFHHAGLSVKQKTVGVLQERQPAHGTPKDLSADVTAAAKRLLGLDAEQRYATSTIIDLLERTRGIDAATIALAQRLHNLPAEDRQDVLDVLEEQELAAKKMKQTGPKPGGAKALKKS